MTRQFGRLAAGACMALATSACYSLDVPTSFDELTREAVTGDVALVENVLASQGITIWAAIHNRGRPWAAMEVMGERLTSSSDAALMWATGQEPRVPLENQPGTAAINVDPWTFLYEANSSVTEMQRNIRDKSLRIVDPLTGNDQTPRALAWAKFIQGVAHGYLAILFDKAAIVNIDVDLSTVPDLPLVEYTEVRDSALKWLNEAAVIAETNTFTLPSTNAHWFWNVGVTSPAFSEIIHTFIARIMVYSARNRTEREAVDWPTVLTHLNRAIRNDFGVGGDGSRPDNYPNSQDHLERLNYEYKTIAFSAPVSSNQRDLENAARVDLRLLGPADTTVIPIGPDAGKTQYQAWLEIVASSAGREDAVGFTIFSPDKRIATPTVPAPSGSNNSAKPIFFRYTTDPANGTLPGAGTPIQPPERGTYYRESNYFSSSLTFMPNDAGGGRTSSGNLDNIREIAMRVVEVDLLKAEALYRMGNRGEAAELVNKTRVERGELPAVGVDGPSHHPDSLAICVPRRYDGSCGDLWDALMYEKRIETFGSHGLIPWADGRGWGCLLAGTVTEFPIPARQLDLLGLPIYTFGGRPGERGSAPPPTDCPLLFNPTAT